MGDPLPHPTHFSLILLIFWPLNWTVQINNGVGMRVTPPPLVWEFSPHDTFFVLYRNFFQAFSESNNFKCEFYINIWNMGLCTSYFVHPWKGLPSIFRAESDTWVEQGARVLDQRILQKYKNKKQIVKTWNFSWRLVTLLAYLSTAMLPFVGQIFH